jgi:type II secretory pathway pseudopilin PulG
VIRSERGIALLVTLLALALFSSLAAGLALSSTTGALVAANYEEAVELGNIADSALELAARELAAVADWNDVLAGGAVSALVDGEPGRRRLPGGAAIDLPVLANELSCGRVAACTDAQIAQFTADRPWGANNPRWRLFMHAPFPAFPGSPRPPSGAYIVVLVGDDGGETDGNPLVDGGGAGQEGRYVMRARVEAFGSRGGHHVIEAELVRVCTVDAGGEVCQPVSRVQSWRSPTPIC